MPAPAHHHTHSFHTGDPLAEKNTRWAVLLTVITMVAEIAGGLAFGSMALLADGWHMSSHAVALGLAAVAYVAARRLANDHRFAFGTWKIEILGSYTSALLLLVVAGGMIYGSVDRLLHPTSVSYDQAITIAIVGLLVNLVCAWLLRGGHAGHDHGHNHDHAAGHGHAHHHHDHHHQDLNLRSAYLHVLADAATSVLAIIALVGGKVWGATWLDPAMGLVGAALVGNWSIGLIRQSSRILLDAEMDAPVVPEIRAALAASPFGATVNDLHVWRVGRDRYACILAVSADATATPDDFRRLLSVHEELAHITVEISPRTTA
jgi:cation diffusion facilitator family transporter